MMVIITAVGCGTKPTDGEPAGDEVQSEVNGESAVQEETLKMSDEAIVAYFQNMLNNADVIGAGTQEAYCTLCIPLQFLFSGDTIEQVLDDSFPDFMANDETFYFLRSSEEIDSLTIFDLSSEGKLKVIGITREIYDDLGGKEYTDEGDFVSFWGGKCLPIAEELHELYGEDPQTKELKEEYFKPYHYQKYFKAYAELLLTEEVE